MNNAIYNEYTVDELQASFGYVSNSFELVITILCLIMYVFIITKEIYVLKRIK